MVLWSFEGRGRVGLGGILVQSGFLITAQANIRGSFEELLPELRSVSARVESIFDAPLTDLGALPDIIAMLGILLDNRQDASSHNAVRLGEVRVDLLQREGDLLLQAFQLLRQAQLALCSRHFRLAILTICARHDGDGEVQCRRVGKRDA